MPITLTAIVGDASIVDGHDVKLAKLTNKTGDFEKKCYTLFAAADIKKYSVASVAKTFEEQVKKSEVDFMVYKEKGSSGSATQVAESSPAASSSGASTYNTPKVNKRRRLNKTLSECSVPEGLKADAEEADEDA